MCQKFEAPSITAYALGLYLALLFLTSTESWAGTSRYAAPIGTGTNCSQSVPCSLTTAISQAVAGDSVVLLNGTYTSKISTVRAGTASQPITIRALNRRQATIRSTSTTACVDIRHSYIRVSGLVVDGQGQYCADGIESSALRARRKPLL